MRHRAIEVQANVEGPVRMIDVYYEAACGLDRLQWDDKYKVVAALCIMIDIQPPDRPKPRARAVQTGEKR